MKSSIEHIRFSRCRHVLSCITLPNPDLLSSCARHIRFQPEQGQVLVRYLQSDYAPELLPVSNHKIDLSCAIKAHSMHLE